VPNSVTLCVIVMKGGGLEGVKCTRLLTRSGKGYRAESTPAINVALRIFLKNQRSPGRPWNPVRPGRLLFISEAPPVTGGFWRIGVKDDLRENLVTLLQEQKFQFPSDVHSRAALAAFLSHGFFLVQALKWSL
jgi:hypothetical protein